MAQLLNNRTDTFYPLSDHSVFFTMLASLTEAWCSLLGSLDKNRPSSYLFLNMYEHNRDSNRMSCESSGCQLIFLRIVPILFLGVQECKVLLYIYLGELIVNMYITLLMSKPLFDLTLFQLVFFT